MQRSILAALWLSGSIGSDTSAAVSPPADLSSFTRGGLPPVATAVKGPGFEGDAEDWPLLKGYGMAPGDGRRGTAALAYERTDPSEYPLLGQAIALTPGGRYRIGVWIRTEQVTKGDFGGATLCMEYSKGGKWLTGTYPPGLTGTNDWTHVEATTSVPRDADVCRLVLYMRKGALGRAWFDDVSVEPVAPRWTAYLIRPGRETIPTDDGRVLIGSSLEGVFCQPPDAIADDDLLCRVEAIRDGTPLATVFSPLREGRIASDIGALPAGPASLRLTLLDTRHRWILGEQSIPVTVEATDAGKTPANACVIDGRGRAVVNGQPFLPVGLYHHAFRTRRDLDLIAASPFNCIMPYNSLFMRFNDSEKRGVAGIREVLDACHERGLKVVFSIKDVYAGTRYSAAKALGVEGEAAVVEKAVASFRQHPALLAWYINDELPTSMLDRLTARRREVNRLDPDHPTWAVFCHFGELPTYGPTCDVFGVDPYPIRNAESRDMRLVAHSMDMAARAVGTPRGMAVWAVPQIMNWGCYDAAAKKDRDAYVANFRDPTQHEMIAMSLQCAIQGAKGFIYYSYSDLSGVISAIAKPDFDRRWPEVCRVAAEMTALEPFLLGPPADLDVAVTVEAGEVSAKAFRDARGRVRILVASLGPGEGTAVLTIDGGRTLTSRFGTSTSLGGGRYRFRGTDIAADILGSE